MSVQNRQGRDSPKYSVVFGDCTKHPGIQNGCARHCPRGKRAADAFGFECTEKAFHSGVIVAAARAAHAQFGQGGIQTGQVEAAGILAALVGMVQQAAGELPAC